MEILFNGHLIDFGHDAKFCDKDIYPVKYISGTKISSININSEMHFAVYSTISKKR